MSGMDRILKINGTSSVYPHPVIWFPTIIVEDADLTCQAGARWEDINQSLKNQGIPLFFPVCIVILSAELETSDQSLSWTQDLVQ